MEKIRQIILYHLKKYKEISVVDLYKLLFQASFGPAHAIKDYNSALSYLEEELNLSLTETISYEDIGNGYVRLYLNNFTVNDAKWILKLMIDSVDEIRNIKFFMDAYEITCEILKLEKNNEYLQSFKEFVLKMIKLELPAVHHSEVYKEKYNPHYRVIKKSLLRY